MYFSKNSRYVLQKAQWFTPSSYFFTCLKGNEKNFAIKYPKEDPTKPPLRRNIPADSPADYHSNVIAETRGKDFSEQRSKSFVSKNPSSPPPIFDDGLLPRSESEIQLPKFTPEQYFTNENQKSETDVNMTEPPQPPPEQSTLPTDEIVGDILISVKSENSNDPERTNYLNEKGKMQTGNISDDPKMQVNQMKAFGDEKNPDLGSSNSKTVHIIIDFPQKLDENLSLELKKPKENVASKSSNNLVRQVFTVENKERGTQKFRLKLPKKWRSKSLANTNKSNKKRFEVQEIEDSGAYILHLKFKGTSDVGVVPEKEVSTRKTVQDFSMRIPVSDPEKKGVIVGEDISEDIKYREKKMKLKREMKSKSISLAQIDSEASESVPASELSNWQQPQYYELLEPDSLDVKKTLTPPKKNEHKKFKSDNVTPVLKLSEAKEAEIGGMPPTENIPAGDEAKTEVGEPVVKSSKPAEKEKLLAAPVIEERAEKKETIEHKSSSHMNNDEFVTTNYRDPHENTPKANSALDDRPPPTDWMVPSFMGSTVGRSNEVGTAAEKKSRPNKKIKISTSDSKKGKGKSNKSTFNPKSKVAKYEKCDFDIMDFKSRANSVPIKCDKPTYAMKLSAAYPPLLNEAMKRRYYRYRSNSVFNDKAGTVLQSEEFETNKKIIEVTPVQISERNERSDIVGCQGDGGLRTNKTTSIPKISDNVSNMANENVMDNKGTASVDSLAMMKKVKEIVDLDLNNAIKIFKPDSASAVSSVIISTGVGEWILDEKELRKCLIIQKSEFLNDMKKAESALDFFNDVKINLPKYLPPTKEGQTEMKLNHSVIILNPDTNKFTVDLEELQEAIKRRTEESFDDVVVEKLRGLLTGSKAEPILVFSAANNEGLMLKSGDSILVFDEETQQWKVDYSILDKRQEQMKIEEELTKRSELILETIEKLEKNNMPSISKPETRDRKTFDYDKEQWKDYGSEKKSKSGKSPFKESDAKEIRRKNSDLYENLFVKKDKTKKCDGLMSTEIKLCKQASTTESGTTKETPVTPQKSETVPKEPEPVTQKKELPVDLDKKTEDDNYWETFLNMTIPTKSEKEIIDVTESKKSKIRAPGPPPAPPAPPTPPTPPVSPPPGPKIEEPKFKIKFPFTEGEKKKKNVKDIPPTQPQPKEKIPKVPIPPAVKEKPKLKLPVTPSKTEKQQESKVTIPPPAQPPASKKKDPAVKPVSPPTPPKKEDPKPLTTVKKEGPKEKLIPVKKKEKDVTSSISSTKKAPKAENKKEPKVQAPPPSTVKPKDDPKTGGKKDKAAADHYISENIVELSRNLKDKNSKIKSNKIETVKLNITADRRLPSKVMEINLNKKLDKTKESTETSKKKKKSEKGVDNRIFYKKFEKYKSPFSDLEYEEKSMKIKSDIASNPNLKKLGNWNKTLVLHDIAKPPENIESWLKDETDKMATLLLKVLQEATDGKPRRKSSRAKITDKVHPKPNPYDNIRKKQETTTPGDLLFKPAAAEKMLEVKSAAEKKQDLMKTNSQFISVVPEVKAIPTSLETIDPLISEDFLHRCRLASEITDDIPGPEVLKRISNTWKIFPIFSTQLTIFTLLRLFQLVNTGKWFLDIGSPDKSRDHAFSKLFAKYGPIVNVQGLLSGSVILIHKPEHLSAVFEQDASIPVRSVFDSLEKSRRESEDKHLPVGICTEWNTSKWAELKKNTNDPLLKGRDKFFAIAEAAGDSLVSNILKNKNQQNYASENFVNEIKRWSLEGLCNVLFEKSFGFLEGKSRNKSWLLEPEKLYVAIEEATSYLSKCERGFQMWRLMTTPSAAGLKQSYRTLSGIVGKQIYQAEANLKDKNEMLKNKIQPTKDLTFLESMLLNDGMTPEEITCNLIDIMIIGTNAMTSALGFLLYDLAQNTRAQNKLLNEIRDILPNKSSRMDIHKFSSLKYLHACLKESLRLHMPVPIFFRVLQNDILLSNYIVPKGTYVVMDYRVSCMREQVFEEPEKFNPERWLEDEKWIHSFHPFTTLPLCHGPRAELAKRVVEMQILACVAKIIRNFQVDYQFGEIQETESIFAFPDKPLKFNFIERDF